MRLSISGAFEATTTQHYSSSNTNNSSFRLENNVMDRRRSISFHQVSAAEKRDVFQLGAVRRNMRHVEHGQMLLSDEALELSNKIMEMGPDRASLLSIGHAAIQGYESITNSNAERYEISRLFGIFSDIRGYHPVGYVTAITSQICQVAFFALHIRDYGANIISCSSLLHATMTLAVNAAFSFKTAFKKAKNMAKDTPEDDLSLASSTYVRLKGMEVFGAGQRKIATDSRKTLLGLDPGNDLSKYGHVLIRRVQKEVFFVHFLIEFVPICGASAVTAVRMY